MSRDEAIRAVILDYCNEHKITPTEFARRCEVSKSYMSKIINDKWGKKGISMTYLGLFAKGMGIDLLYLEKLIITYQNNGKNNNKSSEDISKGVIINAIDNDLTKFSKDDLEVLHSIITNINSEKLNILHSILKNMN